MTAADTPYLIAVSAGLQRLERMLLRVWQITCLAGTVTGVLYGLGVSRTLGFGCAAAASAFLVWFVLAGHLFDRGSVPRVLPTLSAAVEAFVPWVFTIVITLSSGAEYALASWVPPFLFCSVLVSHVARLRPWMPFVLGISGALLFPALYWAFVRERIPEDVAGFLVNQPVTQLARSVTLFASGVIASLLVLGLQSAIRGAESAARERDLSGKYRMESEIASGATGVVYLATYCPEGGFEQPVAVRRLHSHISDHAELLDAFREAAALATRLTHPNIVQVRDFLRVGEAHYLVMEWVEGMTLDVLSRITRKAGKGLVPSVVAHVGMELLAGLEHAHVGALGWDGAPLRLLHRDICPERVLVSNTGEVKINGFAVARSLRDFSRTSEGHSGYMPPERAQGIVDERGDLYAVGMVLWELLLGVRRQPGDSTRATAQRADLHPSWDDFFDAALADAPELRAATASDLWALLSRAAETPPLEARQALGDLVVAIREDLAAGGSGLAR